MPQMKGAGTTLAYIFPGLPYWVGVVLVGAVITLNVALGGMKGITLVQAFQYWMKMFAISVPIFVLMSVYGHYGNQIGMNGDSAWDERKASPVMFTDGINLVHDTNPAALTRKAIPERAPGDSTWLSPFGPLTTKAAKATAAAMDKEAPTTLPLRSGLTPEQRLTVHLDSPTPAQALGVYGELTGRQLAPRTNSIAERVDEMLGGSLTKLKLISTAAGPDNGVRFHNDGPFTVAEVKTAIEGNLRTNGLALVAVGEKGFKIEAVVSSPGKAWLANHEKPLALLYTYSLIIALVCGTAGLPHILVRFYTNPDGVAAKRTTMWVMILIGVFYVFPPVFGVLGRNLMPELYNGIGAKGTDKVVLELPRILNEQGSGGEKEKGGKGADGRGGEISSAPLPPGSSAEAPATAGSKGIPWGSILSGITCAGAFAAFMSTFSGLLVSMTGALAHDVYGRMLKPNATAEERTRMFKFGAVLLGGVAIVLGSFVEALEINFMVGQAFAIAAASYFPLLFMAVWWRKLTMKGAAVGMLAGGVAALVAVTLTNLSTLSLDPGPMGKVFAVFKPLNDFWAGHPLLRILCEQPAIWAVPLAIGLMVIVSKLTQATVPADIRMKMLVLHAPEKLGLKQEYIQEHQHGH